MAGESPQQLAGELVKAGQEELRGNRPLEAAALFEQALAFDAGNAFILHLLAEALLLANKLPEAEQIYSRAIILDGNNAMLRRGRGDTLVRLNRHEEAIADYEKALAVTGALGAIKRGEADKLRKAGQDGAAALAMNSIGEFEKEMVALLLRRGDALLTLDRRDELVRNCAMLASLKPEEESFHRLGQALWLAGRNQEALTNFDRAIALRPGFVEALNNRGDVLVALERPAEAFASYDQAFTLNPDSAAAVQGRGFCHAALERFDSAIQDYDRAIALKPDYAEAHVNRGVALIARKQFGEALHSLDLAIAILPELAETSKALHGSVCVNRGIALAALKRSDEALASFNQAIVLQPGSANFFVSRAIWFGDMHRFDEALADYDRAIALETEQGSKPSTQSVLNKAIILLTLGRLEEGWDLYEQRAVKSSLENWDKSKPVQPQWAGRTPLSGKRLFLYEEQGIGDTIHFSRYALMAERAGAQVIFAVAGKLKKLLATLSPTIRIIDMDGRPVAFDLHCSLMSLPLAFGTRLENIPAATPYLSVEQKKIAAWRARLAHLPGFKVGLVWAGDPSHKRNAERSVPLDALSEIFSVPGVSFVSLQFGQKAADVAAHPEFGILDVSAELPGLDDLGACMEALDLIITIDSAPAHLAGALARPTWTLLPFCGDWRWLLHRTDTPWYPTMQLFRQNAGEQWPAVAARVAAALRQRIKGEQG